MKTGKTGNRTGLIIKCNTFLSYLEEVPKVGAASGEHHLVSGKWFTVAGQRHVHKVLDVAQMAERGQDRRLEIVPSQTVQLLLLLLLLLLRRRLRMKLMLVVRMDWLRLFRLLVLAMRVHYRILLGVRVHISVVVFIIVVFFVFVVFFFVVFAVVAAVPRRAVRSQSVSLAAPLDGRDSAALGMLLCQQIGDVGRSARRRMLSDAGLFNDAARHRQWRR